MFNMLITYCQYYIKKKNGEKKFYQIDTNLELNILADDFIPQLLEDILSLKKMKGLWYSRTLTT